MEEQIKYETWTDIFDQMKFEQSGIALLYRNPQLKPSVENVLYDPIIHLFSLDPGDNYLFNQQPIAFGFTAYIGFEEINLGWDSLRSVLRNEKFLFQSENYYRNYSSRLYDRYSLNDKKKPRPKSDKRLQIDFYSELLAQEQKLLEDSERFYSESQNEEDQIEKENLREYVEAFFDWIQERLIELNPNENQIKGLGGLHDVEARFIFKEFKGTYIHSKTKQEHFIAIFQNWVLPDGFKQIEWIGKKAALLSFMDQVFSKKIEPRLINKYFITKGPKLHDNNRTVTLNPDIRKILEHARTIRSKK